MLYYGQVSGAVVAHSLDHGAISKASMPRSAPDEATVDIAAVNRMLFTSCCSAAMIPMLLFWIYSHKEQVRTFLRTPELRHLQDVWSSFYIFGLLALAQVMAITHGILCVAYFYNTNVAQGTSQRLLRDLTCGIHFFTWFTPIVTSMAGLIRALEVKDIGHQLQFVRKAKTLKTKNFKRLLASLVPLLIALARLIQACVFFSLDVRSYLLRWPGTTSIEGRYVFSSILQVLEGTHTACDVLQHNYSQFRKSQKSQARHDTWHAFAAFALCSTAEVFVKLLLAIFFCICYGQTDESADSILRKQVWMYLLYANVYVGIPYTTLAAHWWDPVYPEKTQDDADEERATPRSTRVPNSIQHRDSYEWSERIALDAVKSHSLGVFDEDEEPRTQRDHFGNLLQRPLPLGDELEDIVLPESAKANAKLPEEGQPRRGRRSRT